MMTGTYKHKIGNSNLFFTLGFNKNQSLFSTLQQHSPTFWYYAAFILFYSHSAQEGLYESAHPVEI